MPAAIQSFYEAVTCELHSSEQTQTEKTSVEVTANVAEIGERGGTRTHDPMIKSVGLAVSSCLRTRQAIDIVVAGVSPCLTPSPYIS